MNNGNEKKKKRFHLGAWIVCLFLACILWFLVIALKGGNYEYTFQDIPLTVVGTPADGYQVADCPAKISVTVTGDHSKVLQVYSKNLSAVVDVEGLHLAGKNSLPVQIHLDTEVEGVSVLHPDNYVVTVVVTMVSQE